MTTSPSTITASCANVCTKSSKKGYTVCYTGKQNKIGFMCFVGDMFTQGRQILIRGKFDLYQDKC